MVRWRSARKRRCAGRSVDRSSGRDQPANHSTRHGPQVLSPKTLVAIEPPPLLWRVGSAARRAMRPPAIYADLARAHALRFIDLMAFREGRPLPTKTARAFL